MTAEPSPSLPPRIRRRIDPSELQDGSAAPAPAAPTPATESAGSEAAKPEYTVGYGKPPVTGRFKPGQSGNPKGRPKALKSLGTIIREKLDAKIEVKVGRKTRKITTREALVMRILDQALKGDLKATATLARLDRAEPPDTSGEALANAAPLSAEDRDILLTFLGQNTTTPAPEADQ